MGQEELVIDCTKAWTLQMCTQRTHGGDQTSQDQTLQPVLLPFQCLVPERGRWRAMVALAHHCSISLGYDDGETALSCWEQLHPQHAEWEDVLGTRCSWSFIHSDLIVQQRPVQGSVEAKQGLDLKLRASKWGRAGMWGSINVLKKELVSPFSLASQGGNITVKPQYTKKLSFTVI